MIDIISHTDVVIDSRTYIDVVIVSVLVGEAQIDDRCLRVVRNATRVAHVHVEADRRVIFRVNVKVIECHRAIVDRDRAAAVATVADVERAVDVIRSVRLRRVTDVSDVASVWIGDVHGDVITFFTFVEGNIDDHGTRCAVVVCAWTNTNKNV